MSGIGQRLADMLLGARAGLVATAAMSLLMLAAKAAGLTGRLPPARVADQATEELPPPGQPDRPERDVLGAALHFGFGAGLGAVFGLATSGLDRLRLSTALGVGYATAVYAVSYLGWIPALNIMPTATRDRPGRSVTMLLGHWLFGAVLGALIALGDERRDFAEAVRQRFG